MSATVSIVNKKISRIRIRNTKGKKKGKGEKRQGRNENERKLQRKVATQTLPSKNFL